MPNVSVGSKSLTVLRAKRVRDGLSPEALAEAIDVSAGTIRRLEAGSTPSPSVAVKVAFYLGQDPIDVWPALLGEAA